MKTTLNLSAIILLLSWLAKTTGAYAQAPYNPTPNPNSNNKTEIYQSLGPALGSRYSNRVTAIARTLADPETARQLAAFTRQYHAALVEQGFSKEEALRIVIAAGIPSFGPD